MTIQYPGCLSLCWVSECCLSVPPCGTNLHNYVGYSEQSLTSDNEPGPLQGILSPMCTLFRGSTVAGECLPAAVHVIIKCLPLQNYWTNHHSIIMYHYDCYHAFIQHFIISKERMLWWMTSNDHTMENCKNKTLDSYSSLSQPSFWTIHPKVW